MERFAANSPLPWLKPGVFAGSLIPLAVTGWRGFHDQLGADAVAAALNQLGYLAFLFLTATLLCTPVRIASGWSWPVRLRRMLGLFAFFYASLHFLMYFTVDQSLNLRDIYNDIMKRKFILAGFLTLLILIPLAATSTNRMIRRLGFLRWKLLHRLSYLAGILASLHFIWRVKKDLTEVLIFCAILTFGFLIRIFKTWHQKYLPSRP